MVTYQAVTTFSREGYECYGKRFVESFAQHWPIPLVVYHESQRDILLFDSVDWRNLDHDPDRTAFLFRHSTDLDKVGTERDPNSQSIRFCHKMFAVTDAARRCTADWLLWIDADVETTRMVTQNDLALCLPETASLSFLGRKNYKYTECGFIGYRVGEQPVRALLEDMRRYYTTDEIFTRPRSDWHDSRCFDLCRERSTIPKERQVSIAPQGLPTTHVWQHSPLGAFSQHHKGPGRKARAYGSIVR
jgi:hypothetical protein